MFFGLFWGDWTILLIIPGFLFSLWAQLRVNMAVERYKFVTLRPGMTGAAVARRILDSNGLSHVRIEEVPGELSDHYDPRTKVLRLSATSCHSNSVAAVGIAAHEAGHAIQHGKSYPFLRLRMAMVPVCNIGSNLAMPLFFIGLLLSYSASYLSTPLMVAGIAAYGLAVLFQLVTLPVEFNASRRAMRCLSGSGTMSESELKGARSVLWAAAMTYVAALATGLLSLLRLVLIVGNHSRRR